MSAVKSDRVYTSSLQTQPARVHRRRRAERHQAAGRTNSTEKQRRATLAGAKAAASNEAIFPRRHRARAPALATSAALLNTYFRLFCFFTHCSAKSLVRLKSLGSSL